MTASEETHRQDLTFEPEAETTDGQTSTPANQPAQPSGELLCDQTAGEVQPQGVNAPPQDSSITNIVTRPLASLAEYGINAETIRHFAIKEYYGVGFVFPMPHPNGVVSHDRVLRTQIGEQKYQLLGDPKAEPSPLYNHGVLADEKRLEQGVFIVGSEPDVWVMHQNGFAALSLAQWNPCPDALAQHLLAHNIAAVRLAYENSANGRLSAVALRDELLAKGIQVEICLLPVGLDGGVRDLFVDLKLDRNAFINTMGTLPLAPPSLQARWKDDPFAGLPEANELGELLPCLGEAELQELPLPQCLIDGVLLAGRPTLLTGKHDLGKSAIALDQSLCVCTGRAWNGRATLPGDVFYIAAEGASGIAKRVQGWKEHVGIETVPNFHVIPQALQLTDASERERLIRTVQAHSTSPALIVVDTLARCCGDADDNSTADMTRFTNGLEEICRATGAAILVIHHNNRSDQYRGSSALPANCDGHLSLAGGSGGASVELKVEKLKDFADGEKLALRREIVTLDGSLNEHGHPQTSVVFVHDDAAGATPSNILSPKEGATLQALVSLCAGGSAESSASADGVTSSAWVKAAKAAGVSKATYDRSRSKLLELGLVLCDAPGTLGARYRLQTAQNGVLGEGEASGGDEDGEGTEGPDAVAELGNVEDNDTTEG